MKKIYKRIICHFGTTLLSSYFAAYLLQFLAIKQLFTCILLHLTDELENWACLALAIHTEAVLCPEESQRQLLFEQEINILTFILDRGIFSSP